MPHSLLSQNLSFIASFLIIFPQWEWETYHPEPEIYDLLFHIRRQPPTITPRLSKDCPIPNAQSTIQGRAQTEDGLNRIFYHVLVTYDDGRQEKREVDFSRILENVSPRELERFEDAEFKAEAEAEAAVKRAEREEMEQRRLEKNAKVAGLGAEARMAKELGRPRGSRGRRRGRGRGRGSSLMGGAMEHEETDHAMAMIVQHEDASLSRTISESEDETDDMNRMATNSPDLMRSAFVANSALPVSPVLRRPKQELLRIDDIEDAEDLLSESAQQLVFEEHFQRTTSLDNIDDSRHRSKRRKTESRSRSRPRLQSELNITSPPASAYTISHPVQRPIAYEIIDESSPEPEPPAAAPSGYIPSRPLIMNRHAEMNTEPAPAPVAEYHNPTEVIDDSPLPNQEEDEAEQEYAIAAIIGYNRTKGQKYYLVRWEGYDDAEDWLPAEDLAGAEEMVREYDEAVARRKSRLKERAGSKGKGRAN